MSAQCDQVCIFAIIKFDNFGCKQYFFNPKKVPGSFHTLLKETTKSENRSWTPTPAPLTRPHRGKRGFVKNIKLQWSSRIGLSYNCEYTNCTIYQSYKYTDNLIYHLPASTLITPTHVIPTLSIILGAAHVHTMLLWNM